MTSLGRRSLLAASLAALSFCGTIQAGDLRVRLIELELQGADLEALQLVNQELRDNPETSRLRGLEYLRGHLFEELGHPAEAASAFARAMTSKPELSPYARYHVALNQARLGHPEVAAGLVATLLAADPPPAIVPWAVRLLRTTLAEGGDCRLLRGVNTERLPIPDRRQVEWAESDCLLRAGEVDKAADKLTDLLEEQTADDVAGEAAERLAALPARQGAGRTDLLIGLAFNAHREFDRSAQHLERALTLAPEREGLSGANLYDGRYALLRDHFWRGRYQAAAQGFAELAASAPDREHAAQALYQSGRSWELLGDWKAASSSLRRAYLANPAGETAPTALFSALRTEWRMGSEKSALEALAALAGQRRFRFQAARAALYLAVADLSQGRTDDRIASWLAQAQAAGAPEPETAYWRGRLEDLRGQREAALQAYLAVLRTPLHPLAALARTRLQDQAFAAFARARGQRLAASGSPNDLRDAWLLLGDAHPKGRAAGELLRKLLAVRRGVAPFLEMKPVPPARWPLWQASLREPEEILLGLGLWEEGAPALLRCFSLDNPSLGLTGSALLQRAGMSKRSLYIAEVLLKRVPRAVPLALLPLEFRRLLYPRPYSTEIAVEAVRHGVDPSLLAAVLREESRWDRHAVSPASARGLAQFVLPTARVVGARIGLHPLSASDLEEPKIAIALAAAYLAELERRFGGSEMQAVAAYNAGEAQALLWASYCATPDPAEYFSKVSFKETREYLEDVFSSRAAYAELY